jgi:hypothetical protein
MDIRDFGQALIQTGDLDPVYVAIHGAGIEEPQMCRLLLAYWCFYHLGSAAWLSEHKGEEYWHWMSVAADNRVSIPLGLGASGRWPRSAERRHFRGGKCVEAVNRLSHQSPEDRVRRLADLGTEQLVMREVQGWMLFGPWIAFKVADMMERCYGASIQFSPGTILMYSEPRAALGILRGREADHEQPDASEAERRIYDRLLGFFERYSAPPSEDRRCGPQELETILCKWKSMGTGHYHVGKDIHEVGEGLRGWGETADRLAAAMPPPVINGHAP